MTRPWRRSRALVGAVVAATAVTGGLTAMLAPAHATSSFTLSRLAGNDRYDTASVIDQAAYPAGETTALLADGVTGHQSDALSASGVEGVFGVGVLLTDNTDTVPSSTLSALSVNKVQKIVVVGGTGAVSQAQISQLQSHGYQVSTPYQGTTRWQTMKLVDESMGGAGTDASGNATAILASGDDAHLVDALSAGGLAYAKHFPIILTNSAGPGLQPEAQQVISDLGIKHLIVVGGTASIPASEYTPPPSGVTKVDVESGKDRSETSKVLADFAITNTWLANSNLTLARGDDGADALAGAAFAGVRKFPTVVTNSPSDNGSAPAFATEHAATLAGSSYIFGGTSAVPDSQQSAVQSAGQGQGAGTAAAGAFGTAGGSSPLVTAEDGSTFTEGNLTYTYKSGDTYQIVTTASTPGSSPSCTADQGGYQDFQARLSNGDSVSGTYQPTGTSTFCLNDIAPHPPSSVSYSSTPPSGGGVTVTWTVPSTAGTDNVTGYTVWRAPAAASQIPGGPATCPAAYTVAPGASPQTPPAQPPPSSNYTPVATNVQVTGASSTGSYSDTTATGGNQYCYAVSSESPNAAGAKQTGTAQPAGPANQLQAANPQPVSAAAPGSTVAPRSEVLTVQDANQGTPGLSGNLAPNDVLTATFDQPVAVGSSYQITLATPCKTNGTPDTCADYQAQLNPADSSASVSNGGTQVSWTMRTPPLITSSPSSPPSSYPISLTDLEVLSASAGSVTSASNPSLNWNLPGSAVVSGPMAAGQPAGLPNLSRVFGGNGNADLPAAPTVTSVIGYSGATNPDTVTVTCNDPSGQPTTSGGKTTPSSDTVTMYDSNGNKLGTIPCGAAANTTPSGTSNPFVVTPGATYLFTETGAGQESLAASFVATSS